MSETPPASDRASVLTVATLTKLHGIRGELKLRCTAEYLAFLKDAADDGTTLTLRMPETGDEYEVTFASVRGHESAPIVAIDGVDDRSAAEAYRGAQVCVSREALPSPADDEYFLADLVGCTVHDCATGEPIGAVAKAEDLPANVVLTIAMNDGTTVLAPLAGDAVPSLDVEARRIDIDCVFLGVGEPAQERDE